MKLKKMSLRRILVLFVVISIIYLVILGVSFKKESDNTIENIIYEDKMHSVTSQFLIQKFMHEVSENLLVIRNSNELMDYADYTNDVNLKNLESLFIRVMQNKENYDQLRYINKSGDEVVRVNRGEDKIFVLDEALQNKSSRYYFENTIGLANQDVYVSRLDLNIENQKIELPIKPMIRFSTPIYDRNNQLKGILIINYKGQHIIDLLSLNTEDNRYFFVNNKGEYIKHIRDENDFSFMFESKQDINLINEFPELWLETQEYDEGQIKINNKLFTFDKISKENVISDEYWYIIYQINLSEYSSLSKYFNELISIKNFFVMLITFIFISMIEYFRVSVIEKDSQIDITQQIADSTNDCVIITDELTNITYVNETYEAVTGYKSSEVLGMRPSQFKSGKHSREFYQKMWNDINEKGIWEGTLWDRKKNGLLYPKHLKIIAVYGKSSQSKVHHYIGIFSDVTAKKRKNDIYKTQKDNIHSLVLPNEDMMIDLLENSVKDQELRFMVLNIAIENYNQLITISDEFEVKLSSIFTKLIKPHIHSDDYFAQTGRNLFSVVINLHHINVSPKKYVKKIHQSLSQVVNINDQELFLKSRIGVSFWPMEPEDIKKLLINSMIALEWTSRNKSLDFAFYKDCMIDKLNNEIEIEVQLRQALDKNEFSLVYQPQIDIRTKEISGVEALLRWNNAKLGMISPNVFIPIAEKNLYINAIGDWIISEVCRDLKLLKDLGYDLKCAINISVKQLDNKNLIKNIIKHSQINDIDLSNIEVEITENVLISEDDKHIVSLSKIKESGISIAIDDFGTGYSSLAYLKTLPIDKIKIDRSFVKDYPVSDDGKLLSLLVNMAHTLNKEVLTEGAETIEQIEYLKQVGCTYVQGYYYSKPLSLNKLTDFIRSYNLKVEEDNE